MFVCFFINVYSAIIFVLKSVLSKCNYGTIKDILEVGSDGFIRKYAHNRYSISAAVCTFWGKFNHLQPLTDEHDV